MPEPQADQLGPSVADWAAAGSRLVSVGLGSHFGRNVDRHHHRVLLGSHLGHRDIHQWYGWQDFASPVRCPGVCLVVGEFASAEEQC